MTVKSVQIEDEHEVADEMASDSTKMNGLPPKSKYVYMFDSDLLAKTSILFPGNTNFVVLFPSDKESLSLEM